MRHPVSPSTMMRCGSATGSGSALQQDQQAVVNAQKTADADSATAAADLAEGRPLMSADAELARRLRICQACPMLHDGQCRRCGCPVGRKALVASEPCPEGRW